jgi:hypothetical protein
MIRLGEIAGANQTKSNQIKPNQSKKTSPTPCALKRTDMCRKTHSSGPRGAVHNAQESNSRIALNRAIRILLSLIE